MIKFKINKKIISESKETSTLAKKIDKVITTLDIDEIMNIAFNLASNPEINSQLPKPSTEENVAAMTEQKQTGGAPPGYGSYKEYTGGLPDPERLRLYHNKSADLETKINIIKDDLEGFAMAMSVPAAILATTIFVPSEKNVGMAGLWAIAGTLHQLSYLLRVKPERLKRYWEKYLRSVLRTDFSLMEMKPNSQLAKDMKLYRKVFELYYMKGGHSDKEVLKNAGINIDELFSAMDRILYFYEYRNKHVEANDVGRHSAVALLQHDVDRLIRLRNEIEQNTEYFE